MHKAPAVEQPREIFDSHGRPLGRAQGFRPDPSTGSLGLELELSPEIAGSLQTDASSVWIRDDQVMAVRKDRVTLDLSLEEIQRLVRRLTSAPELAEPAPGGPPQA